MNHGLQATELGLKSNKKGISSTKCLLQQHIILVHANPKLSRNKKKKNIVDGAQTRETFITER